jgi:DNA-binding beta-propeller fold protein YncE
VATLPRSRSIEFVFCQKGENILFKVQWVKMTVAGQTSFFASKFYPSTSGDIGLLVPNKFKSPEDVTLDPSGNLFVVDSETDSLYRFSTKGMEAYSFGGTGSGPLQFRRPHGVAVFDKTVYVADTGNNRILRFRLSTELQ